MRATRPSPPPGFDQRGAGFARTFGARIDIGAFERQAANSAPSPGADSIQRFASRSVSVSVTQTTLLANDTDIDGDLPLTIIGVSGAASGQATVSRSNGYVFYDPAPGFTGADSFMYQVQDSLGATAFATVRVSINSGNPPVNATLIGLEPATGGGTQARLTFTDVPGRTYRVEYTNSLATQPIDRVSLGFATADAEGQFEIIDLFPSPRPPQRFYRAIPPMETARPGR